MPVTAANGIVTMFVPLPLAPAINVKICLTGSLMMKRWLVVSDWLVNRSSLEPPSVSVITRLFELSSVIDVVSGMEMTTSFPVPPT